MGGRSPIGTELLAGTGQSSRHSYSAHTPENRDGLSTVEEKSELGEMGEVQPISQP